MQSFFSVKTLAKIAVLAAVAAILMLFEIPLWFAPEFYKIDLSEVAVLIGGFALGPVAAAFIELTKILLNFLLNGTITGGIGEFANFLIGCAFVLPASAVYRHYKDRKAALWGMLIGTVSLGLVGSLLNYFLLLPVYAKIFGAPIDALISMGTAINPRIDNLLSFVLLAVLPFNLLKGAVSSIVTFVLYKRISGVLHK